MRSEAPPARGPLAALSWIVLALTVGPIGTAAYVLGFLHGESPCILCWAQRTGMVLIALTGLFILRFGPRPRYVGFAVLLGAAGVYMALRHSALHVARDGAVWVGTANGAARVVEGRIEPIDLHAMNDAWDSVESGDVVIVSHQLPIWMVHRRVRGKSLAHDPRRRRCALSSITTFERSAPSASSGTGWVEVEYRNPAAGLAAQATDVGAV